MGASAGARVLLNLAPRADHGDITHIDIAP